MPRQTGGGSVLANLNQARKRLATTRAEMFSRDPTGRAGGAPVQPPPPSPAPANPNPPETVPQPQAPVSPEQAVSPAPNEADVKNQQLAKVQAFLDSQRNGGQAPSPAQVRPMDTSPDPAALTDAVQQAQATNLGPETQFYRIAGRPGSPREIASFATRLLLEQQLKRPPTREEVATAMARTDISSPSVPVAFEG